MIAYLPPRGVVRSDVSTCQCFVHSGGLQLCVLMTMRFEMQPVVMMLQVTMLHVSRSDAYQHGCKTG